MQNNFEELYADNFYRIVEQETFSKQIWEIFHIMCEGDIFYGAVFPSSTSSADSKSILSVFY